MTQLWQADRSRRINERHVVELTLELVSPAHIGNGDSLETGGDDEITDMSLLSDLHSPELPLLAGTNLAGALRSAVRRWELGHFRASTPIRLNQGARQLSHALFGDPVDENGKAQDQLQSPLIIDDALGRSDGIEIRDGVRLNPKTRTASDQGLYNGEFWQAGTTFPIRLELAISEEDESDLLKQALSIAIQCLVDAESQRTVTIGARKRRGFGVVKAKDWKYRYFDMRTKDGLKDWLMGTATTAKPASDIISALTNQLPARGGNEFTVSGTFQIDGSLLIRSGTSLDSLDIDMVHLHSKRNGQYVPILSGTSLGGALRTRCWAIAEYICDSEGVATRIVEDLFGPMLDRDNNSSSSKKRPRASRLTIQDGLIVGATTGDERLIQSRVSIDRFTGGALNTALFDEQPVFGPRIGGHDVVASLSFTIHEPTEAHIGLFLLALKDLATGDLPVGGEIAVGRGILRLHGPGLNLRHRQNSAVKQLSIGPNGEVATDEYRKLLNGYVQLLHQHLTEEARHSFEGATA